MDHAALKQRISQLIRPDVLDDWVLDEMAEPLAGLEAAVQQEILKLISAIWPVSHALCFAFLEQVPNGLQCLSPSQLPEWVNGLLDVYEAEGLHQARKYMADVENNFLCLIRGEKGLRFEEMTGRLLPYVRGLSGRDIDLAVAAETFTDTSTIFLPAEITLFPEQQHNFLLYKLIVSFQWGFIRCNTFLVETEVDHPLVTGLTRQYGKPFGTADSWLANFFNLFPDPLLAKELFHLAETCRITGFLNTELPGLMREAAPVRQGLLAGRPGLATVSGKGLAVEGLKQWLLDGGIKPALPQKVKKVFTQAVTILASLADGSRHTLDSAALTADLFDLLNQIDGEYWPTEPLAYQGHLRPAEAQAARLKRRQEVKQQFITGLAALLPKAPAPEPVAEPAETTTPAKQPMDDAQEIAALMPPPAGEGTGGEDIPMAHEGPMEFITIDDTDIRIPEAMRPLLADMQKDLGHIPAQYISSARQFAGSGLAQGPGPDSEGEGLAGLTVYDEWDFRRNGFRKNWCRLLEKEIQPVKGAFVEHTLQKYHGVLKQLKRQFEMLRTRQRFVKRQRDGDDIDLDAVIESLADAKAGLAPSERLFIRLLRDERDIAAVFLVDMSSSTEGWVSKALKESLVLMCEGMEVLGDRYAVYGFSGMRRSRSELYHVKHLNEAYDDEVKGRIAAIFPQDYTRMGPPLRHVTRLLSGIDARVRLLITLSDGKPEDYDDYKGDYAVEDTRHALIEAKSTGIHPFCITIDQQCHDYIGHMYGEVNYIFINDVNKLPARMPEIYRTLTT